MTDKFEKTAGALAKAGLSALGIPLNTVESIAKIVLGDGDAMMQRAIIESLGEEMSDLYRRVAAVEAELRLRGEEPARVEPLNAAELGRQFVALLPQIFGAEARAAYKNAFARRIAYAATSDRSLTQYWWQRLTALQEAEVRALYMIGDGNLAIEGNICVARPGSRPERRYQLSDPDRAALTAAFQRLEAPENKFVYWDGTNGGRWIITAQGKYLWQLISDALGVPPNSSAPET